MLFESAVPTSSMSVLWGLVGGESHPSEIALGREDLAAEWKR